MSHILIIFFMLADRMDERIDQDHTDTVASKLLRKKRSVLKYIINQKLQAIMKSKN